MAKYFTLPNGRLLKFQDEVDYPQMEAYARSKYGDLYARQEQPEAPAPVQTQKEMETDVTYEPKGWVDAVAALGTGALGSVGGQLTGIGSVLDKVGLDTVGGFVKDQGQMISKSWAETGEPYRDPTIDFGESMWQGGLGRTARGVVQESGPTVMMLLQTLLGGAAIQGGAKAMAASKAFTSGKAAGSVLEKAVALFGGMNPATQQQVLKGVSPFVQQLLKGTAGGLMNRASEGLMEGGGAYEQAIAQGMTDEEATTAATKNAIGNLPLAVMDIAQFTGYLSVLPKPAQDVFQKIGKSYLTKIPLKLATFLATAASEGQEEAIQDEITSWSLGHGFDPKVVYNPIYAQGKHPESWNLGALTGFVMEGGVGTIDTALDWGVDKLKPESELQIINDPYPDIKQQENQQLERQAAAKAARDEAAKKGGIFAFFPGIRAIKPLRDETVEDVDPNSEEMRMDIVDLAAKANQARLGNEPNSNFIKALKSRWAEVENYGTNEAMTPQVAVNQDDESYEEVEDERESALNVRVVKPAFAMAESIKATRDGLVARRRGHEYIVKVVDFLRPSEAQLQSWGKTAQEYYDDVMAGKPGQIGAIRISDNKTVIYVSRGYNPRTRAKLGTISHEIFHAAFELLYNEEEKKLLLRQNWQEALTYRKNEAGEDYGDLDFDTAWGMLSSKNQDEVAKAKLLMGTAEEMAAETYKKYQGPVTGVYSKFKRWIQRLAIGAERKLSPEEEALLQRLRSGEGDWRDLIGGAPVRKAQFDEEGGDEYTDVNASKVGRVMRVPEVFSTEGPGTTMEEADKYREEVAKEFAPPAPEWKDEQGRKVYKEGELPTEEIVEEEPDTVLENIPEKFEPDDSDRAAHWRARNSIDQKYIAAAEENKRKGIKERLKKGRMGNPLTEALDRLEQGMTPKEREQYFKLIDEGARYVPKASTKTATGMPKAEGVELLRFLTDRVRLALHTYRYGDEMTRGEANWVFKMAGMRDQMVKTPAEQRRSADRKEFRGKVSKKTKELAQKPKQEVVYPKTTPEFIEGDEESDYRHVDAEGNEYFTTHEPNLQRKIDKEVAARVEAERVKAEDDRLERIEKMLSELAAKGIATTTQPETRPEGKLVPEPKLVPGQPKVIANTGEFIKEPEQKEAPEERVTSGRKVVGAPVVKASDQKQMLDLEEEVRKVNSEQSHRLLSTVFANHTIESSFDKSPLDRTYAKSIFPGAQNVIPTNNGALYVFKDGGKENYVLVNVTDAVFAEGGKRLPEGPFDVETVQLRKTWVTDVPMAGEGAPETLTVINMNRNWSRASSTRERDLYRSEMRVFLSHGLSKNMKTRLNRFFGRDIMSKPGTKAFEDAVDKISDAYAEYKMRLEIIEKDFKYPRDNRPINEETGEKQLSDEEFGVRQLFRSVMSGEYQPFYRENVDRAKKEAKTAKKTVSKASVETSEQAKIFGDIDSHFNSLSRVIKKFASHIDDKLYEKMLNAGVSQVNRVYWDVRKRSSAVTKIPETWDESIKKKAIEWANESLRDNYKDVSDADWRRSTVVDTWDQSTINEDVAAEIFAGADFVFPTDNGAVGVVVGEYRATVLEAQVVDYLPASAGQAAYHRESLESFTKNIEKRGASNLGVFSNYTPTGWNFPNEAPLLPQRNFRIALARNWSPEMMARKIDAFHELFHFMMEAVLTPEERMKLLAPFYEYVAVYNKLFTASEARKLDFSDPQTITLLAQKSLDAGGVQYAYQIAYQAEEIAADSYAVWKNGGMTALGNQSSEIFNSASGRRWLAQIKTNEDVETGFKRGLEWARSLTKLAGKTGSKVEEEQKAPATTVPPLEVPEHLEKEVAALKASPHYDEELLNEARAMAAKDSSEQQADSRVAQSLFEHRRFIRHYNNFIRLKQSAQTPGHYGMDIDAWTDAREKADKETRAKFGEKALRTDEAYNYYWARTAINYNNAPKKTPVQKAQIVGVAKELKEKKGFQRLLGRTKAVDEEGNPIILVHGTDSPVDFGVNFSMDKRGSQTGARSAHMGFFFTDEAETADRYTEFSQYRRWIEGEVDEEGDPRHVAAWELKNKRLEETGNDQEYERLQEEQLDAYQEIWEITRLSSVDFVADMILGERSTSGNLSAELEKRAQDKLDALKSDSDMWSKLFAAARKYNDTEARLKEIDAQVNDWITDDRLNLFMAKNRPPGPRVVPAVLNLENPLVVDFASKNRDGGEFAYLLQRARSGGYDGAIFRHVEDGGTNEASIYVAFRPQQIFSLFDQRLWEDGEAGEATEETKRSIEKAHVVLSQRQDPLRLLDAWHAGRDTRIGEAAAESYVFGDRLKKLVDKLKGGLRFGDDKTRNIFGRLTWSKAVRDIDRAIHIYNDMQADPDALDRILKEHKATSLDEVFTPDQVYIINLAQGTVANNPDLVQLANDMREQYDKAWREAEQYGVIGNYIEHYVSRVWLKKGVPLGERKDGDSILETWHNRHRKLPTIFDGWARGLELGVEGAIGNLADYKTHMATVMETQDLIRKGQTTMTPQGKPMMSFRKPDGKYVEMDSPLFYVWTPVETVKGWKHGKEGFKQSGNIQHTRKFFVMTKAGVAASFTSRKAANNYLKTNLMTGAYVDVFTETQERKPLYVEKELADKINRIIKPGFESPVWKRLLRANALIKNTVLMTSFFHHQAFMRSYLLGSKGPAWTWDPAQGKMVQDKTAITKMRVLRAYQAGLDAIANQDETVMLLMKHGLTVGRLQDWDEQGVEDVYRNWARKPGLWGKFGNAVNSLRQRQSTFLFKRFGAGLKIQSALIEFHHNMQKYGHLFSSDEIARMTADLMNEDFGGLHHERMGITRKQWELARFLLLAPDWTGSNYLTVKRMVAEESGFFTRGRAKTEEAAAVRSMYQHWWAGALMKGFTAMAVLNIATALLSGALGDDDDDNPITNAKLTWRDDWTRLLWMDWDITPVYRALTGDKGDGRRRYMSILGHFKDPMKWVMAPGRSLIHKGSPVFSAFVEATTGKDWKDDPYTTVAELLGEDDKGFYKDDGPDHKAGDPKGGKFVGKLTKRYIGYDEQGGVLSLAQMPSFLLSEAIGTMPVQVQEAAGAITGERAAFDAIMRSLGMHESAARGNEFEIAAQHVNRIEGELNALRYASPGKYSQLLATEGGKKSKRIVSILNSTSNLLRSYRRTQLRLAYYLDNGRLTKEDYDARLEGIQEAVKIQQTRFLSNYQMYLEE